MSSRSMAHYLIIMLMVMLLLFRFIVLITTVLAVNFPIVTENPNIEMVMIFIIFACTILFSKTKMIGGIIYLIASFGYFGMEFVKLLPSIAAGAISQDTAIGATALMIELVIPIFAFFILLYDRKQELHPTDTKTDFFYKNEAYDRKYDDRADKNNYRTM